MLSEQNEVTQETADSQHLRMLELERELKLRRIEEKKNWERMLKKAKDLSMKKAQRNIELSLWYEAMSQKYFEEAEKEAMLSHRYAELAEKSTVIAQQYAELARQYSEQAGRDADTSDLDQLNKDWLWLMRPPVGSL